MIQVSWDRDGRPVDDNERFHLLHEGSFFCVDVAPVTLEDAGRWSCHAHNSEGSSICSCQLNVLGECATSYSFKTYTAVITVGYIVRHIHRLHELFVSWFPLSTLKLVQRIRYIRQTNYKQKCLK